MLAVSGSVVVCVCTGTGGGAGRGRGKGRGNVGDLLSGGEVGELGSLRGKLVLGFRKLVVRDRLESRVPGVEEEEDMVIICYLAGNNIHSARAGIYRPYNSLSRALKNETLSSRIPNFYNEADLYQFQIVPSCEIQMAARSHYTRSR